MVIQGQDFYDLSNPTYLQQGDIFPDLPLVSLPPSKELVVLRTPGTRDHFPVLLPGDVEAVPERTVNAFDSGQPEHTVVSAVRGSGILITQTCDLEDSDYWLVSPIYELASTSVDRGNLFAGKFANLFGLPTHPLSYFPDSYIDLSDLRPARRESVDISDRIASLTRGAQNNLSEKLARSLSRRWGFGPGDKIPTDGKYRCNQCNNYFDIDNRAREFKAGQEFPDCDNCRKIHKTASWYLLVEHKKS